MHFSAVSVNDALYAQKLYFKHMKPAYKVWIEIRKKAVKNNVATFRAVLGAKTKLYAVVKSNAYGHGLTLFSGLADACGVDGFCVDSVVEGAKLRVHGILKPILVLGYTLPGLFSEAKKHGIAITVSSKESLAAILKAGDDAPNFHIKIDTGMHRQGLQPEEVPGVIRRLYKLKAKSSFTGLYTHFAMAKNRKDTAFTDRQLAAFRSACASFEQEGFSGLMRHASATGGALLGEKYHMDMARIGIGLYGIWPSAELERQLGKKIVLHPALSLHSVISEKKTVAKGEGVGYDMTEVMKKPTDIAIVPVGYWHGIPRTASSVGSAHVGPSAARIVGRVSMDMIMIDVTGIPCRVGSEAVISPVSLAQAMGASPYEVVTRINPLIHKAVI